MNKSKILHIYKNNMYIIEKIVVDLSIFAIGFLTSRVTIIGSYPLGIALVSAIPGGINFLISIFGTSLGYLSEINTIVSVRYVSTLVSVCALRWLLDDFKNFNKYIKLSPFITTVPMFITGIAIKLAYQLTFISFAECLLECVLVSSISYILRGIFESIDLNKSGLNARYKLLAFVLFIIFYQIVNLNLLYINIINAFLIFLTLTLSYKFKIFGGSISGIIQSLFYMIVSPTNTIKIMSSPISGMISGYSAKFGKYSISSIYIISDLIIHFQLNSNISVSYVLEEIIGAILFLTFAEKINFSYESKCRKNYKRERLFNAINTSLIADSFYDAQVRFEKISNSLDRKYRSDSKTMLNYYLKSIPKICKFILNASNSNLEIDRDLIHRVKKMMKNTFGLDSKISFRTIYSDKYLVQIEVNEFDIKKDISALEEEILYTCRRSFMTPEIFKSDEKIVFRFCEKPKFRLRVQAKQHTSYGETNCGDCYKTFYDGLGNFYAVISDGMGKGNLASISGSITVQIVYGMLRSGVDIETTIFIANSVLMEKSSDESLATLDILKINLFTGNSEFYKLGSASSFIKTKKKVDKISSISPPIGILSEINYSKSEINVKQNDIIIMMSDGITDTGEEWIEKFIRKTINDSDLTQNIIKGAKNRRERSTDDDMTVITIEAIL